METREKERASGSWSALFHTIRALKLPWVWIIVGVALNLGVNQMLLELPNMTANLLSGDFSNGAIPKAILFYVVYALLSLIAMVGMVQAQSYSARRTRKAVWQKMLGLRMEYFDRNDPSDLMSTMINDGGQAAQSFVNIIINLLDLYYVVMALVRIGQYHWILAVSCFVMLPLKYVYALVMGRKVQVSTAKVYGHIGVLTGFLADRINHLPLIKTYTNEEAEGENGQEAAHGLLKAYMKLVHLDNISLAIMSLMEILQKFIVVVVAVLLLQRGEITIAMWLAFFLFTQSLFSYMDQIFDVWIRIKSIQGTFQRITGIMCADDEDTGAVEAMPENGDITFDHVTFTYPETDAPALDDVSFTIPRGTCAAIVGLCGSGKTTTVSLLERFYVPDAGTITVGGADIQSLSLGAYRRHFAYVQQGAEVFSGTLREALTYGIERDVADEEIFAAAERTGFNEYLSLCGNDLTTEVASGGVSMSGGQSQRLVLTRELLRGGDIILMDEPTSALDVRVSAKIQQTMDEVFADKTRILITHDLSLARNYDRIIVMENGHLVGDGSHEELLKTCATYQKMNENAGEEAEA